MGVRHINPEGVHRSPAFSQAVVVEQPAKTIYIGGQNGVDADGKVVGPSVEEQARQAFRNLATILESEGASLTNIVHWSIAVVDGHTFDEGVAAFQQYGSRPIHRPRSPSTSSPAWAPAFSSRSTLSPSCDARRGGAYKDEPPADWSKRSSSRESAPRGRPSLSSEAAISSAGRGSHGATSRPKPWAENRVRLLAGRLARSAGRRRRGAPRLRAGG